MEFNNILKFLNRLFRVYLTKVKREYSFTLMNIGVSLRSKREFTLTPFVAFLYTKIKISFYNIQNTIKDIQKSYATTPRKVSGFTIAELLAVIFVSALVSTTVLVNFGAFTSNTEFENQTLNIALTIRDAQSYGASSLISTSINTKSTYGVYFNINGLSGNGKNSFVLFADKNTNNKYDAGTEEIKTIEVNKDFKIKDVCVGTIPNICESSDSFVNGIVFLFKSPNPDAHIYWIPINFNNNSQGPVVNGRIIISNPKGKEKIINVTDTGQIYIN